MDHIIDLLPRVRGVDGLAICRVVGVDMPDAVRADPLHDPAVTAPVHRPFAHVMTGRLVDTAGNSPALAFRPGVNAQEAGSLLEARPVCYVH